MTPLLFPQLTHDSISKSKVIYTPSKGGGMGRTASGREYLPQAKAMLKEAKTIDELRQVQALIFPLEYGFSIAQTAAVIGISRGWACQLRNRFIRNEGQFTPEASSRGGRRRENMTFEEEQAFLAPFFETARCGGILIVNEIHQALEQHLGRKVALSSVYTLLHRHNWRKLTPDKRHVQADIQAQEDWKKNSPLALSK
jgi:transposase